MKNVLLIAAALVAIASPSSAAEYWLNPAPGIGKVFVWKTKDALAEGGDLIRAGALQNNPEMVAQRLACIASPTEEIAVYDISFTGVKIMVVKGENMGCLGYIDRKDMRR